MACAGVEAVVREGQLLRPGEGGDGPVEPALEPAVVTTVASSSEAGPAGPASPGAVPAERGFWVQLGAFRERTGADDLQRRAGEGLQALAPWLATVADAALFRVQAGPYASRDEARGVAERVRAALGLVPMVIERR